jgi:hypothetical protein
VIGGLGIIFLCGMEAGEAAAQHVRGNLSAFGQVREGDQTRETEAPTYLYGDLGLDRLRHGTELGAVFQLGRDFGIDDGTSDFYAGFARVPAVTPGLDVTVGRQFLSEGPGGAFVADAGKVRFDPGWPVAFTVFGGRPRYFEPTFSTPILDDDEWIFGGNVHSSRWRATQVTLGYLQHERDHHVLRQLVTGTLSRSFITLPGVPNLYGSVAFDADRQNLDLGTAGVNFVLPALRLQWNVEGTYYQPQDHDHERPTFDVNRREDPIFELFSVTEMAQWRSGLRYSLRPNLAALVDYSFQHYDHQKGDQRENSHVASAGLLWLPGGDGLEVVRAEYYVVDSDGGRVNGGKATYESRVYDRLVFRSKIDVLVYDKVRNEGAAAVSGMLALGYIILPGLVCELDFEANHNDRFNEDFRFGFVLEYNFRHALRKRQAERASS